jgi:glycyl-tRNA synthetase (class II)
VTAVPTKDLLESVFDEELGFWLVNFSIKPVHVANGLARSRADLRHDRRDPVKLYRRQDEIGTLWCITVDVDTLDSMTQERVPVEGVKRAILDRMEQAPS